MTLTDQETALCKLTIHFIQAQKPFNVLNYGIVLIIFFGFLHHNIHIYLFITTLMLLTWQSYYMMRLQFDKQALKLLIKVGSVHFDKAIDSLFSKKFSNQQRSIQQRIFGIKRLIFQYWISTAINITLLLMTLYFTKTLPIS